MMKAIVVNQYGGPEVLKIKEVTKPQPKDNEVLVKIVATSITAASTMMRKGTPYFGRLFTGLKRPKVKTPGTDLVGVIEAVGKQVTSFKVGDKVIAETGLNCGAYAEYICLEEKSLIVQQPSNVSAEEATGIIDGACTALAFFTDSVQLKEGQKVLINGASGSIGTAAIQLAKYFKTEVTAVCSAKNKALVKDLGADYVLDYNEKGWDSAVGEYDVIFDTVGKLSYKKHKKMLNHHGVFMTPVLSFATLISMMFVSPFQSKKLKFAATGMRKHALMMRDLVKVALLMEQGHLQTVIDKVYSFEQIQEAHSYVDKGRKRGNVIVVMNPSK